MCAARAQGRGGENDEVRAERAGGHARLGLRLL